MTELTNEQINNFKEAVIELNKLIPKIEQEIIDANMCLEYFSLNVYDEDIEKKAASIITFYLNDVTEELRQANSQKKHFEQIISRGKI